MWKAEVESDAIEVKQGVSARTNKPYKMREQCCWVYLYDEKARPNKHPQKVKVTLSDDRLEPYPVGTYYVHPGSVYLDKWGQLSIRAELMPVAEFQAWLRTTFAPVAAVGRAA